MGTSRRTICHLLGCHCRWKKWALFLYCGLLYVQHDRHLIHPFQGRDFLLPGPATDHSHVANIQRKFVTLAFVSSAPPASSPSPNTSGGTNLQVFDGLDCSTLQLPRVDRMWKGVSKEV